MVDVPKVAILFGFGINCDRETAAVFELVGAKSTRVHLNEFISKSLDIHLFDILDNLKNIRSYV